MRRSRKEFEETTSYIVCRLTGEIVDSESCHACKFFTFCELWHGI